MGEEGKVIVTLVGVKQAKKDFVFIHEGPLRQCRECGYYKVCMTNLETGRIYRVIGVRGKSLPCRVHEEGVRAVEVVESGIEAAVESRITFQGGIITFQAQECRDKFCSNYRRCVPIELLAGDRCKILELKGSIECPLGRLLVVVVLRRLALPPSS